MMDFSTKNKRYHHERGVAARKKPWLKPVLAGVIVAVVIGGGLLLWPRSVDAPNTESQSVVVEPEPVVEPTEPAPAVQDFDAAALQAALKSWVSSQNGTASVVIADDTGEVLAETNADRSYFAASIYKLYVAYEGYRAVDAGTYSLSQPYLGEWTRGQCLDKMIRESHSPCAEKMWAELGKQQLTDTLVSYGINNTSMTGITTTAEDAAIMLARIEQGKGLSEKSRSLFLKSMQNQEYKDALQNGFAEQTVQDKVGFRGSVEYHDVGIIEFEDGRRLIVSVMTENVGTRNIRALAAAITAAVEQ